MAKTLQEIMTSDISDIMLSDFAVNATFKGNTIKVIFDNDFKAVNFATGEIESAGPMATCKTSDVSSAIHGDTFVINSITYYIIGIQPDGTGLTVLILSRDAG